MSRRDAIARLPGHAAALDLDAKLVLSGETAGTTQTWSPNAGDSVHAMNWGTVEAEPEVTEWLLALPAATFGHVRF